MSDPRRRANRREEPRFHGLTGQRMSWTSQGARSARHDGWILDVSRSGVGLMLDHDEMPAVGECISVRLRPHFEPVSYEVVRQQPGDQRLTVVGCRRVYGRVAKLTLPRREAPAAIAA